MVLFLGPNLKLHHSVLSFNNNVNGAIAMAGLLTAIIHVGYKECLAQRGHGSVLFGDPVNNKSDSGDVLDLCQPNLLAL